MPRLLVLILALSGCANAMNDAISDPTPDAMPVRDAAPDQARASAALWLLVNDLALGTNELVRLDPETFAIQHRANLHYPGGLWELAGTGSTHAYAVDRELNRLLEIDLEAGAIVATTPLGADMLNNGRGFGVASDGTLWGIFTGTLAQIDPASGALSHGVTQQYGANSEALETCGGQLYMTGREAGGPRGEKLYAVNRTTGAATLRGVIGTQPIDIDTLACAADGSLFGLDTDPIIGKRLYRIATATGAATIATDLEVTGDINGLHVTPATEPSIE